MTVLTLALLAGSQPAAPRLAPVHQIGPQSRRQSPHTPCAPLVRTDALTLTWQKADRHKRSAPTSSSLTPWPNPHSACGTAAAPLPAISCLGAFRPPAARALGEVRHCRQPKTCTTADICSGRLAGPFRGRTGVYQTPLRPFLRARCAVQYRSAENRPRPGRRPDPGAGHDELGFEARYYFRTSGHSPWSSGRQASSA
jgi:hypothetical protein